MRDLESTASKRHENTLHRGGGVVKAHSQGPIKGGAKGGWLGRRGG